MPELPEVENVARGLKYLEGRKLKRLEIFDQKVWFESELGPEELSGKKLLEVSRRGKYLLLRFERGLTLLQHLRMTGKMLEQGSHALPEAIREQIGTRGPKARQVRCRFEFGSHNVVFYDTRRFGTLTAVSDEENFFSKKGIAPDPFGQEERAREHFLTRIQETAKPIKAALLDQSLVAGVGNIYADESLHRAGVSPRTPARRVKDPQRLWDLIREILAQSMEEGGTSVVDYLGADGEPGRFGDQLRVYGREGERCVSCGKRVKRIVMVGRSTHFCPHCQRGR
jgi:formamidopyrimidine-DNA glycosylase